jgi:hypothetical protein
MCGGVHVATHDRFFCRDSREKLLALANYGYLGHWGVVCIGGFVTLVTLVYILVATCAKRTAFLKIVGVFVSF